MLGENILKLRKNMKLSQEELGAKVGVTRQTFIKFCFTSLTHIQ